MRFKGGGLHGQVAPSNLVDTHYDYRAWRTYEHEALVAGRAAYDLYRWEPGSGWMAYVGTVFGLDGPLDARRVRDVAKLKPPLAWQREFDMQARG